MEAFLPSLCFWSCPSHWEFDYFDFFPMSAEFQIVWLWFFRFGCLTANCWHRLSAARHSCPIDWPGLNAIWVVSTALWSREWSPHFGVPRVLFPNKEIAWESICDLQLLSQPSQCREQPESDSYISNICLLHSSFISLPKTTVHRP